MSVDSFHSVYGSAGSFHLPSVFPPNASLGGSTGSHFSPPPPPNARLDVDALPIIHAPQQQQENGTKMLLPTTSFFPAPPAVTDHMFGGVGLVSTSISAPRPPPATINNMQPDTYKHDNAYKEEEKVDSHAVMVGSVVVDGVQLVTGSPRSARRPTHPKKNHTGGGPQHRRRVSVHSSFGPRAPHTEHDPEVLKQLDRASGCGSLNRAQITHVTESDLLSSLRENLPGGPNTWDHLTDMTDMETTRKIGFVTPSTFQQHHAKALEGAHATNHTERVVRHITLLTPPANARASGEQNIIEAPTRAVQDTEPQWRKNLQNACGYILYVPHRHLMDEGAAVIRSVLASNRSITKLDARANGFTPSACAELMSVLPLSGIQSLDLSAMHGFPMNHLGELGAHALKQAFQMRPDPTNGIYGCGLRALRLQNIGSHGILHLINIQTFEFAARLQVLDLRNNNIGQSSANGWVPPDSGSALTVDSARPAVASSRMSSPGATAAALTTTLGGPSLKGVVNTPHSSLNSANKTTHGIPTTSTTFLTETSDLSPQLYNPQYNTAIVFDSLMIRLCKSLKVSRVEKLLLSHNHLHEHDGNGDALISLLSNPTSTITYLDISHNKYGQQFGDQLGHMLNKDAHSLTQLVLDHNPAIRDSGASSICSGLTSNSTLKYLSMRGCGLTQTASIMSPWYHKIVDIPNTANPTGGTAATTAANGTNSAPAESDPEPDIPLNLMGPNDGLSTSWIEMLRVNQVLLRLDLSENQFNTKMVAKLFRYGISHNTALTVLELAKMKLSDEPFRRKVCKTYTIAESVGKVDTTKANPAPAPSLPPDEDPASLLSSMIHSFQFNSILTGGNSSLTHVDLSDNDLTDSFVTHLYKEVIHHNVARTNLLKLHLKRNNIQEKYLAALRESMIQNERSYRARHLANYTRTWKEIRGCEMTLDKTNKRILECIDEERALEAQIAADLDAFARIRARELEETNALQKELNDIIIARETALADMTYTLNKLDSSHTRRVQDLTEQQNAIRSESAKEKKRCKLLQTHQAQVDAIWTNLTPVRLAGIKTLNELTHEIDDETRTLASLKKEASILSFKYFMTAGRILRAYQFFLLLYAEQPRALRVSRRMKTIHLQTYARVHNLSFGDVQKLLSNVQSYAPQWFVERNLQKYFELDLVDFFEWFFDEFAVQSDTTKKVPMQQWAFNLVEHYMKIPATVSTPAIAIANLSVLQPTTRGIIDAASLNTASAAHSPFGSVEIVPPAIPTNYSFQEYRHFLNLQLCYTTIHEFGRNDMLQQVAGGVPLLGAIRPTKDELAREREREKEIAAAAAPQTSKPTSPRHAKSKPSSPPAAMPRTPAPAVPSEPLAVQFANEHRLLSSFDIPLGSTLLFLLRDEAAASIVVKQRVSHTQSGARASMQLQRRASADAAASPTNAIRRASERSASSPRSPTAAHKPMRAFEFNRPPSDRHSVDGPTIVASGGVESFASDIDELEPITKETNTGSKSFYATRINELKSAPNKAQSVDEKANAAGKPVAGSQTARSATGRDRVGLNPTRSRDDHSLPLHPPPAGSQVSRRASVMHHAGGSESDGGGAQSPVGKHAMRRRHRPSIAGFGSTTSRRVNEPYFSVAGSLGMDEEDEFDDQPTIIRLGGGLVRTIEEDESIRQAQREKLEKRMRKHQRKQPGPVAGAFGMVLNQNNIPGGAGGPASVIAESFPHLSFHSLDWHEVDVALWWSVGELKSHLCQLFHIPDHLVLDLLYVPGLKAQSLDPDLMTAQTLNTFKPDKNAMRVRPFGGAGSRNSMASASPCSSPRGTTPQTRLFLSPGQEAGHATMPPQLILPPAADHALAAHAQRDTIQSPDRVASDSAVDGSSLHAPADDILLRFRHVTPTHQSTSSQLKAAAAHPLYFPQPPPPIPPNGDADDADLALSTDVSRIMTDAGMEDLLHRALIAASKMEKNKLKKHRKALAAIEREKAGGFYAGVSREGVEDTQLTGVTSAAHANGRNSRVATATRNRQAKSHRRRQSHVSSQASDDDDGDDGAAEFGITRRRLSVYQTATAPPANRPNTSSQAHTSNRTKRSPNKSRFSPSRSASRDYDFGIGSRALDESGLFRPIDPAAKPTNGNAATKKKDAPKDSGMSLEEILRATSDIAREVRDAKSRASAHAEKKAAARAAVQLRAETIDEHGPDRGVPFDIAEPHDGSEYDSASSSEESAASTRSRRGGTTIASRASSRPTSATLSQTTSSRPTSPNRGQTAATIPTAAGADKGGVLHDLLVRRFVPPTADQLDFRDDILSATSMYAHHKQLAEARLASLKAEKAQLGGVGETDSASLHGIDHLSDDEDDPDAPTVEDGQTNPTAANEVDASAAPLTPSHTVNDVVSDAIGSSGPMSLVDLRWSASSVQRLDLDGLTARLTGAGVGGGGRFFATGIGQVLAYTHPKANPHRHAPAHDHHHHRHTDPSTHHQPTTHAHTSHHHLHAPHAHAQSESMRVGMNSNHTMGVTHTHAATPTNIWPNINTQQPTTNHTTN